MRHSDPASRRAFLCCLFCIALAFGATRAVAQAPGGDGVYYSKQLTFRIPFSTDPNDRRIREVQLYASEDQGKSWRQIASARPGEKSFSVIATHEGWYWFAVRTVDVEDHAFPPTVDQSQAKLKVCVDTQPPSVSLRPAANPPPAGVAVEWEVRDENIDLDRLQLDYRIAGGEWTSLPIQKLITGSRIWNPSTNAPLEVRLQARDMAGNTAEQTTTVAPSAKATGGGPDGGVGGGTAKTQEPVPGGVRVVGSKRISLDYEVVEVGKSGLAVVELWWTRNDARNWAKYNEQPNPQPPYTFEVSEEGLYGFTLVARNNAGLGEPPPKAGDQPQTWVEVDLTKPVVRLNGVDVGRGPELGTMAITWSAGDKNLARRPITLSYAESPEGPWQTIAEHEENTGRYVWRMPENVPFKVHVRVEAADLAGNVGSDELRKPVIVDMSQPKVKVRNVGPGGK